VDDRTRDDQDPRKALTDSLDWLRDIGLIDDYVVPSVGSVGEVTLSVAAAQLARDGRQPLLEPGFQDAIRGGPSAARAWLAREAEGSSRRRISDPPR
jgi:hypothetical protein